MTYCAGVTHILHIAMMLSGFYSFLFPATISNPNFGMPSLLSLSEVSHYWAFEVDCSSFTSKYFSMSSLKRVSLKSQCILLVVAEYILGNQLTSTWNINKPFGFLLHRFNFPGKFQYLSPLPRGRCWLCTSNSQVYFLFKTLLLSPDHNEKTFD